MANTKPEVITMAQEIQRKGELVNYELLDFASGGHLSMLHVGMTDEELVKRLKSEGTCSTFTDKNCVNIALSELFSDPYAARLIAEWVIDPTALPRKKFDGFANDKLGRMIRKNGAIVSCDAFAFIFQKHDEDYRNKITGLPFDVVTAYVED